MIPCFSRKEIPFLGFWLNWEAPERRRPLRDLERVRASGVMDMSEGQGASPYSKCVNVAIRPEYRLTKNETHAFEPFRHGVDECQKDLE